MADKDYSQLTSLGSSTSTDLLGVYPVGGPLKKLDWTTFLVRVVAAMSGVVLTAANNLSDLASASAARANLALGSAAQLASSALFQVANNLSEVANAATARTNLGAAAADDAALTGGVTLTGSTKQNVQPLAALDFDLADSDFFTKSISTNSTFTFSNPTATKGQGFIVKLTTSSGAVPTWPASVDWPGGVNPSAALGNGVHMIGFLTLDGGTSWQGVVAGAAFA